MTAVSTTPHTLASNNETSFVNSHSFLGLPKQSVPWLLLLALALIIPFITSAIPWLQTYPSTWILPLADWVNSAMDAFVSVVEPFTRMMSATLEWPMLMLRDILQWLPWPAVILAVVLIAVHASGPRLALICLVALLYIALSGYWRQAMNTMALVGIAVPLSLLLGLVIGIAAQRTRIGSKIVPPALDLMQTMPTFAYLIPLLVLFGFGPVVGLIASAIYACPPMVRNVHLGLKQIPEEIKEAAIISGSSSWQRLFWVELPSAMGQIKVGINQTIMAALSMVIIASVIGGFDDIGWEVLSTMRKARFGDSLLAGFVIVLLAIVIDRISAAYTLQDNTQKKQSLINGRGLFIGLVVLAVACVLIRLSDINIAIDDPAWVDSLSKWLDFHLDSIVVNFGNVLTQIKDTFFYYYLLPLRIGFSQAILPFTWGFDFTSVMRWGYAIGATALALGFAWRGGWAKGITIAGISYLLYFGLTGMPWLVFGAAIVLLAWQVGNRSTAIFAAVSLLFILVTGMWERAMLSVYLCGAAVILSFLLGASLGIWAATSTRVSSIVRPISDTFQTIPLFVFLIPVLMFFQIGEFTALLAIIAYAFVPAIRYTENGLRQVSPELVEVAVEQGCTPWQIFWQVKIPLAMPTILVGLNQTIMYAFAMLVIAALVGTTGLGQQVYVALSSADTGLGMIAGLSMALLAMVTDRILQTWASRRFAGI